MKLKDFVKLALEIIDDPKIPEVEFDLGVESNMTVNPNALNRIRFKVSRIDKD